MRPAVTPGAARPGSACQDERQALPGEADGPSTEVPLQGPRPRHRGWWRRRLDFAAAVALWALATVPLAVAAGVLARPRWYPLLDLAMTELRLRDVATGDTPLVGLAGRIGDGGSHPGPLSFYALAPFHRLFGGGAWAMQVASAASAALATGVVLWVAHRRGRLPLLLGVAAALAVLARGYGTTTLTEAWNPYLPVLWWVAFLLAVWAVLDGDWPLLPVAVVAGTFCMQTHVPYVGLVGGVGAVAVVRSSLSWRRCPGPERRRAARWAIGALVLGALLWAPPVIDQLGGEGNLGTLGEFFTEPAGDVLGPGEGLELLLVHLDPGKVLSRQLVADRWAISGSPGPGVIVLAAWALSVLGARRLRHPALLRLHLVVGAALFFGALSFSRLYGYRWYYLGLWAFGTLAVLLVATGWTAAALLRRRQGTTGGDPRIARAAALALAGVTVVATASFTVDAASAEPPFRSLSLAMGEVMPPTIAALKAGTLPGTGPDGRYFVTWGDSLAIGSQGFGVLLELERQGFEAGVHESQASAATPHRVLDREDATAVVHISLGSDIEVWRAKPGAVEVAHADVRTEEERKEFERLATEVVDGLARVGRSDVLPGGRGNLFAVAVEPGLPDAVQDKVKRMLDLGVPTAVFVAPTSVQ